MFNRLPSGEFSVDLADDLRSLIESLLGEYRDLLLGDADPALRRLYPTAYPEHESLDEEYRRLTHDDLLATRLTALETFETSLRAATVTEDELMAWMQSINGLRLVLGTRLDIGEDDEPVPPDHPEAGARGLYELLTMLLGQVLRDLRP